MDFFAYIYGYTFAMNVCDELNIKRTPDYKNIIASHLDYRSTKHLSTYLSRERRREKKREECVCMCSYVPWHILSHSIWITKMIKKKSEKSCLAIYTKSHAKINSLKKNKTRYIKKNNVME